MSTYRLNDKKMFADITDGIAIVINSETGIYYGMNAFATEVYQNIAKGISTDKILTKIKNIAGMPTSVDSNYEQFIKMLLEKEIIVPSQESDEQIILSDDVAKESDYALELKEYNDAQELLLADPIHEVKEEEGWTPEKSSLNEDKDDVARREAKMGL